MKAKRYSGGRLDRNANQRKDQDWLIARGSRVAEESKTVGDLSLSVKSGALVAQWEALLRSLKAERFRLFPASPIINANSIVPTVERVEEDESTDYVVGQMDNRT